jgi:alkanesulfonate monooxygenase SsuD/methylene tetrahydromethanopterin reductase-like flavin-dependent oxidoreductase (luciferase family)
MTVDFGLALPSGPPKGQVTNWMRGLEVSLSQLVGHFKSLWMTDHFFWEDGPTFEAWTVLAHMAARWPQFEVGPMVLGQSYRNPALLAKMGATLQALCGGRLVMGIGAGWKEDEYHAYGYAYPSAGMRIEQLEDTLEILKRMWTVPGKVTYHGKHYSVTDAYCEPKPDPVPPILVGGGGRKTTLLAVRYADMWNMPDAPFSEYAKRIGMIRQHCTRVGRDPASLRLTWFGRLAVGKTEAEAQALGGSKWTKANAFVGTPSQVVEQMGPFVEAGVDYFMVDVLGLPNPDVVDMVLEEVLLKVQILQA